MKDTFRIGTEKYKVELKNGLDKERVLKNKNKLKQL